MACYLTGAPLSAPDLKRVVVVFTDVFGFEAANHRLFADVLASRLCSSARTAVLVPDLFRGNPIAQPLLPGYLSDLVGMLATLPMMIYRMKFNHPPDVIERDLTQLVFPWIESQVAEKVSVAEIGASCVGFCFGGWVVGRSLGLGALPIKCGVGVHPSFNTEGLYWGKESDVVANIGSKPVLLLPAGNDSEKIKAGGEHVRALAGARGVGEDEVSVEFPDMKHGWVSRGDGAKPDVARCQEEAMCAIVKFFEEHHV